MIILFWSTWETTSTRTKTTAFLKRNLSTRRRCPWSAASLTPWTRTLTTSWSCRRREWKTSSVQSLWDSSPKSCSSLGTSIETTSFQMRTSPRHLDQAHKMVSRLANNLVIMYVSGPGGDRRRSWGSTYYEFKIKFNKSLDFCLLTTNRDLQQKCSEFTMEFLTAVDRQVWYWIEGNLCSSPKNFEGTMTTSWAFLRQTTSSCRSSSSLATPHVESPSMAWPRVWGSWASQGRWRRLWEDPSSQSWKLCPGGKL